MKIIRNKNTKEIIGFGEGNIVAGEGQEIIKKDFNFKIPTINKKISYYYKFDDNDNIVETTQEEKDNFNKNELLAYQDGKWKDLKKIIEKHKDEIKTILGV